MMTNCRLEMLRTGSYSVCKTSAEGCKLLRISGIQPILGGWRHWSPWIALCLGCTLIGATHHKDGPSSIVQPFWKCSHRHAPKVCLLGYPRHHQGDNKGDCQILPSLTSTWCPHPRVNTFCQVFRWTEFCQEQALVCFPSFISTLHPKVKADILFSKISSPIPLSLFHFSSHSIPSDIMCIPSYFHLSWCTVSGSAVVCFFPHVIHSLETRSMSFCVLKGLALCLPQTKIINNAWIFKCPSVLLTFIAPWRATIFHSYLYYL